MRKLLLIIAAFAAGCAFADRTANREWVGRNFAPSNVVPRVKAVEDMLTDMEGKFLTTNLVGKTIVTGTNTVLKMGAGTRVNGTDDMYIRLGGGDLIFPDNLGISVRGNRTLATWGITNAYTKEEAEASMDGRDAGLRRDLAPSNLVPRVEALENKPFPQKWATGNLTNANGIGLVELKDVTRTERGGANWSRTGKTDGGFYALAVGNGRIVAGSRDAGLWYSDGDGMTWARGSVTTGLWMALAYGNGRFVAGSGGSGIWYSGDGANWTQGSKTDGQWYGLAYGNGRFVAVDHDGSGIWYSNDGANWTRSMKGNSYWYCVAYGNGRFVAGNADNGGLWYSDDGVSWNMSSKANSWWSAIAYGNGRFVAGSYSTALGLWYSDDGENWTQSAKTDFTWPSVGYGNGRFIAGSNNGTRGVWYSDDGVNWTKADSSGQTWKAVAYSNGRFVAGTGSNGIWHSDDITVRSVPLVQRIRVNGTVLTADEDNVVDIPVDALKAALGIQ